MINNNAMGDARSARWARHASDARFHVVDTDRPYSVITLCNGAWSVEDECVEWMSSPPEDERCHACQRRLIDPIERGLAELVNNSEVYDLGGEA